MKVSLWEKRERGSTLQIVLVVGVVISLLLFSLFQLLLLKDKLHSKRQNFKEAVGKVNYMFDLIEEAKIKEDISSYLLQLDDDSLLDIGIGNWGIYELLDVSINKDNTYFQKLGLQGARIQRDRAVYLAETNSPLLLAGRTKIIGNVSLPKEGLKEAYVSGAFYQGKTLIVGNIEESHTDLPEFRRKDCLFQLLRQVDSLTFYNRLFTMGNLVTVNSFREETLLYRGKKVDLENVNLGGNIIISGDSSITVHSSARLEDVLLVAPVIRIESGVKGSFQVFASKEIQVEENASLIYPSVLFLDRRGLKEETESYMNLGENVTVEGSVVFVTNKEKEQDFLSNIVVSQTAMIKGEIYCMGNLELRGVLEGSVYTKNFITYREGNAYVNYLYDVTISPHLLPQYTGGLLFNGEKRRTVKWLY